MITPYLSRSISNIKVEPGTMPKIEGMEINHVQDIFNCGAYDNLTYCQHIKQIYANDTKRPNGCKAKHLPIIFEVRDILDSNIREIEYAYLPQIGHGNRILY